MQRKLGRKTEEITVNREDILEKSRNENRNMDEMEKETSSRAGSLAAMVGGLLCIALIILESLYAQKPNMSYWGVYLSMTGTMLMFKYYRLRRTHELVFGIIQILLAVAFFAIHIIDITGGRI